MRLALLPAFVLLAACSRASTDAPGGSASATPSAALPKSTLAIGAPISAPAVALADIAKNPGSYANKTVTTSGKVTSVCQEMGCWMEMQDASGRAHIRMHGHNFFVPKTASGHIARVQATLVKGKDEECSEQSPSAGQGMAKVELDATGVELD